MPAQPYTLYRVYRSYIKRKKPFPELLGKLYLWQLFRALAFVHAHGCCHRDVKPHNVLVDSDTGRLVLIVRCLLSLSACLPIRRLVLGRALRLVRSR